MAHQNRTTATACTSKSVRHGTRTHAHALVTPYFTLKWYKKGTGHLTFTRLDLVAQLNAIPHRYFPYAIPARQ